MSSRSSRTGFGGLTRLQLALILLGLLAGPPLVLRGIQEPRGAREPRAGKPPVGSAERPGLPVDRSSTQSRSPVVGSAERPGVPTGPGRQGGAVPRGVHGTLHGLQATMPPPVWYVPELLTYSRPIPAARIVASRITTDKNYPTWAARRSGITASSLSAPPPGSESVPRQPIRSGWLTRDEAVLERLESVDPAFSGLAVRIVAEPAVAGSDAALWMTGNWFAARSTDAGRSWSFVDPSADFPEFTSDQDVAYDRRRDMFMWYRQGGLVPGLHVNSLKLAVSTDSAMTWCTYTLRPTDLDGGWGEFDFDYPHLGLSDNFLYVSSTFLTWGDGYARPRMVLMRMGLGELSQCSSFPFTFWTSSEGWDWTPVETGATSRMYLGDTQDPGGGGRMGTFRLYTQDEAGTDLTYIDRTVPPWTNTNRNGLCPVPGGGNPCARTDQRVTSGWVRRAQGSGEIGFLWNVRDGGAFPYPYVEGVTLNEATGTVTGRPLLWSSQCAWQYAAAAPGGRGDLGIAAFYFCPSQPPAHAVGLANNPGFPWSGWSMVYTRIGSVETGTTIWGDYLRVRPSGAGFLATGYTLESDGARPFNVFFRGRRDLPPRLPFPRRLPGSRFER